MNEIKAKIFKDTFWDENDIYHASPKINTKDEWNGYLGGFFFLYSNIERIDLY